MMTKRLLKNRTLAIAILLLVVAAFGISFSAADRRLGNSTSAASAAEPAVLATVEGREIQSKIYRMYLKNGVEALGLSDKTAEGKQKIEQLKEGIISELIDRALIEAEAVRRGLTIPEERLAAAYHKRVSEMGGEEPYRAYLKEAGVTDDDFRQIVRQEIYGELLRKEFEKAIKVSEPEARDFYNREKANPKFEAVFVEPEQVRASHILIGGRRSVIASELRAAGISDPARLERAINEEIGKRRSRASQILSKAKAGADFARLARESSEDAGTRDRGGDLGLFTRNTHTARFDDAAFSMKAGQVSDIVETDYGFHIIKVSERRARRTRDFAEVRAAIEQELTAKRLAGDLTRWLEERRRAADIRIAPVYRAGN
jgi:parvulin-like peptidyl-prolyl isomerase